MVSPPSCLGRVLGWRYAVNARYLPASLYALARDDVPGLLLWLLKGRLATKRAITLPRASRPTRRDLDRP